MARKTSTTILWMMALSMACWPPAAHAYDLYWTDFATGAIQAADFSDLTPHTLVSAQSEAYRIAIDADGGKMYWTGFGYVRRANLDGTAVETLINHFGDMTLGLALDSAGGKMYWTEFSDVYRANLDGTDIEEFDISTGLYQDLTLDLLHGHVYISDWGGNPASPGRVLRTNLDGSGLTSILDGISRGPVGIGVDPLAGHLYWARTDFTSGLGGVQRANLDGTDTEDIVTGQNADPLTLDLGSQRMYWAGGSPDGTSWGIWRAGLDGSDIEMLPIPGINPAGVAVIPEPTSLALLAVCVVCMLGRRRKIRPS
ncbi:MAG: PEP-CTERM sorting domain-containing protein [Planctomycetota bacterium]